MLFSFSSSMSVFTTDLLVADIINEFLIRKSNDHSENYNNDDAIIVDNDNDNDNPHIIESISDQL